MDIHAGSIGRSMRDAHPIQWRVVHIAQRPLPLDYGATHLPVSIALMSGLYLLITLGRLAGHIGEGFIDTTGLSGILQIGMLLGKAMTNLVAGHIQRHQRVEVASAIAKGHGLPIPESILVVFLIMHPHL